MKNREFYNLYMDFESLRKNKIYAGDVDMYFECDDHFLVLGEAKLQGYHVKGIQEKALTTIIDEHKSGGVLIEIEHTSRVQDGATSVDIGDCLVRRAYFNGEWHEYDKPLKVLTWMTRLSQKHGGMIRI